jgi:hypothetical protein
MQFYHLPISVLYSAHLFIPDLITIVIQVYMSSLAQTMGSWVQIPLEAWMSVCVYSLFVLSRVGSGLAIVLIPRPRSPYRLSVRFRISELILNGNRPTVKVGEEIVKISLLQAVEAHRVARG